MDGLGRVGPGAGLILCGVVRGGFAGCVEIVLCTERNSDSTSQVRLCYRKQNLIERRHNIVIISLESCE